MSISACEARRYFHRHDQSCALRAIQGLNHYECCDVRHDSNPAGLHGLVVTTAVIHADMHSAVRIDTVANVLRPVGHLTDLHLKGHTVHDHAWRIQRARGLHASFAGLYSLDESIDNKPRLFAHL
jgi:hypothetical protein